MSITVGDNFSYQGGKPLDARFQFSSVANMKAFAEASLYDGCLAYIPSSKKYYTYDSSNTVDTTTGRWRELETGGGGGTSNYNDLTNKPQIASVTLSGNTELSTLGLTANVGTQLSGSSTKSYVTRGEKYDWNTCGIVYGVCSTSASTTAKSVTVNRGTFNFETGARIAIKFSYNNTASAPTLTVNSTTKNIKCIDETGSTYTPVVWWDANDIVEFVYDGTQFLMQPTTGMMFKIHGTTMDREDIYSTSEKVIGCWTDGRPLYQKTFSGAFPSTTAGTWASASIGTISNLGNVTDIKGWYLTQTSYVVLPWTTSSGYFSKCLVDKQSSTGTVTVMTNNTGMSSITAYVTVKYTKTTDAANSFNYADPNDYSTTEKIVGTWVDGKDLYQKTFINTLPNCTTDGTEATKLISMGVTAKLITGFKLVAVRSNGTEVITGNYYVLDASEKYIKISGNNSSSSNPNTIGLALNKANWANMPCYITVQYTKS